MKHDISLLVELAAAVLARQPSAADKVTVVVNEAHRAMPVLEAAGATAYVNLGPLVHQDFRPVTGGQPSIKERVCAATSPGEAAELVKRAHTLVVGVPSDPDAVEAMPLFDTAGRHCIFHGTPRAAGWARITPRLRGGDFTPLELPNARLLISREAVEGVGGRQMLLPGGLIELASTLATALPHVIGVERLSGGGARLRLRPDPLQLTVSGSEALSHNVVIENRALFNARGIGGLSLPLEGRGGLQLLVRNVRDRIDALTVAVDGRPVPLTRIDYTEFGAVISLPATPIEPGRDALMFLALPRSAVPGDGFCDVGAVTQTLELSA